MPNQPPTSKNRQNGKRFPQRTTNSSYADKLITGNKIPSRRKIPMVSNHVYKNNKDGKEFNAGSQGGHISRFPLPSKNRNSKKGRMGRMRRSGDGNQDIGYGGKRNPKKPYPKKPGGHRLVPQGPGDNQGPSLQQWNGPRLVTQGPNHFQNFVPPNAPNNGMHTPGGPRNQTPGMPMLPMPPMPGPNGQMGMPLRHTPGHPGDPHAMFHPMPPRSDGMIPQLDPADLKNKVSPNDNTTQSTNVTNNYINVAQQVVQAPFNGFMPGMMTFQPVQGPHPTYFPIGPEGAPPPGAGVPFMPMPVAAGPLPQGPYVPVHYPIAQPQPPGQFFIPTAGSQTEGLQEGKDKKEEHKTSDLKAGVKPFVPTSTAGETDTGGEGGEPDNEDQTPGEREGEFKSSKANQLLPPLNPQPPFLVPVGPMAANNMIPFPVPQHFPFVPPVQVLKPLPLFHPHHPVAFVKPVHMFPPQHPHNAMHPFPNQPPPPPFYPNPPPQQQQQVAGLQNLLSQHVVPPPTITPINIGECEPRVHLDDKERKSKLRLLKNAFSEETLQEWFNVALFHIPWTNPSTTDRNIPRLVSWITNPGCICSYSYAGAHTEPQKKPSWLGDLEKIVCQAYGIDTLPDAVNINLYRNQEDCVGWHADDESLFQGLHRECTILSLSLGETRSFQFRLKNSFKDLPESVELNSGDLCSMEGLFQRWYVHRVPQEESFRRPRINFTWRWILEHRANCPLSYTQ